MGLARAGGRTGIAELQTLQRQLGFAVNEMDVFYCILVLFVRLQPDRGPEPIAGANDELRSPDFVGGTVKRTISSDFDRVAVVRNQNRGRESIELPLCAGGLKDERPLLELSGYLRR